MCSGCMCMLCALMHACTVLAALSPPLRTLLSACHHSIHLMLSVPISCFKRGQDEKEHQQERQKQQQQQSKRPQQGGSSSRPSINSRQEQGIQPTHTFSHQASPHHNHENEKDEGDKDVEKWKKEEEEGGLTGMTHAHVRSYVHMTKDSAANPDVIELRNRAMATAAVYSVKVAVK